MGVGVRRDGVKGVGGRVEERVVRGWMGHGGRGGRRCREGGWRKENKESKWKKGNLLNARQSRSRLLFSFPTISRNRYQDKTKIEESNKKGKNISPYLVIIELIFLLELRMNNICLLVIGSYKLSCESQFT